MEATKNNADTLFMEIFAELLEIAKAYFQELFKNEKPGVYTLKDIYNYIANCESLETKQGKAERLTKKEKEQAIKYYAKSPYYSNINPTLKNSVLYLCKVSNNIISIEKGNFKCSFDVIKVFEYLERFKQLSGAKEKLEFVKEGNQVQKSESNCLCAFDITFDKKDKTFLTAKTKNSLYCVHNNVLIDINLGKIYSTDAFICKSRNVKISNLFGSWDKHVCISFDVFKKVVGKSCKIMVDRDNKEDQVIVTIETTNGEIFECRYNDFNKNISIEEVHPILYKELKLTVKDSKQFIKDLKVISKTSKLVSFEIEKGSDQLRVNYITEFGVNDEENKYGEFHVQLSEPSNFTYRTDNKIDRIISCLNDWNGEIYITKESDYNKLSFVSDSCDNCFMVDGGKMNCFDKIRNKVDYSPNQLTPVYCEKETKEPGMYEPKEGETIEFTTENKKYFDFNVSDYADGMLELVGLDSENLIFKVNQDSPKELKVIQDIKLYDKTGKIAFTYDDGSVNTVVETTFNGDSVLQSVLQKINESM